VFQLFLLDQPNLNPHFSFSHDIYPMQLDTYNYDLILPKGSSLEAVNSKDFLFGPSPNTHKVPQGGEKNIIDNHFPPSQR
jgi:hypothetical protein